MGTSLSLPGPLTRLLPFRCEGRANTVTCMLRTVRNGLLGSSVAYTDNPYPPNGTNMSLSGRPLGRLVDRGHHRARVGQVGQDDRGAGVA